MRTSSASAARPQAPPTPRQLASRRLRASLGTGARRGCCAVVPAVAVALRVLPPSVALVVSPSAPVACSAAGGAASDVASDVASSRWSHGPGPLRTCTPQRAAGKIVLFAIRARAHAAQSTPAADGSSAPTRRTRFATTTASRGIASW